MVPKKRWFVDDELEEFDKFVLYSKVLELLNRYGIKPVNVSVEVDPGEKDQKLLLALSDRTISYPDGSTPTITNPEHHERLKRLRTDLGIEDGSDTGVYEDYSELYDKLSDAIEKAPKSFTKYR